MKRIAIGLSIVGVLLMTLPFVALGTGDDNITICHAAGLEGTIHFVTLTISPHAVYGPAGHFNEDGTPQAGHEQDYFGACIGDTTTTTEAETTTTSEETTTTAGEETTTTTEPVVVNPICIDCNNATEADLMQLTGVNQTLAQAIIANRPYETLQDLVTKSVMTPGQLLLIIAINLNTGAFAGPECLSLAVVTTIVGETTTSTGPITVEETPMPEDTLPFTGAETLPLAAGAAALLAGGSLALLATRKELDE